MSTPPPSTRPGAPDGEVDATYLAAYVAAFEASPVGLVVSRPDGVVVRTNRAFADWLGYDIAELVGRHYDEVTFPADRGLGMRHGADLDRGAVPGGVAVFDKRYLTRDGRVVWGEVNLTPVVDGAGEPLRVARVLDVTARRAAEEAAARESSALAGLLELQHAVGAAVPDADRVLALVAEGATGLLPRIEGCGIALRDRAGTTVEDPRAELLFVEARGVIAALRGRTWRPSADFGSRALRTASTLTETDLGRAPQTPPGVESAIASPVLDAAGRPLGLLYLLSGDRRGFDETDVRIAGLLAVAVSQALHQCRTTEALRRSEERVRLAFAHSPVGVVVSDLERGRLVNQVTNELADDLVAALPPGPRDGSLALSVHEEHACDLLADPDAPLVAQIETVTTDGRPIDVTVRSAAASGPDGVRSVISILEDVTERVAVERRLAEQASLLEHANDAILVRDLAGVITYWNPGAERLYGWSAAEAVGHHVLRLIGNAPVDQTPGAVMDHLLTDEVWEGEVEQRRRDGRPLTVLSRKSLLRTTDGEPYGVLVITTDVTERRAAERALTRSERLFRGQFLASGMGQVIRDLDDVLESVNPAFAAMLGYDDPAELVGRPARALATPHAWENRDDRLPAVERGERDDLSFETQLVHRDGSLVDVHFASAAIRDDAGRPVRFISTFLDITARKAAERDRDRAIAELRESNAELAAMSQLKTDLMGLLSHQIKNPVAALMMGSEVAAMTWAAEVPADAGPARFLDLVQRKAEQIRRTIDEVLLMVATDSGRLVAQPEPVEVTPLLLEVATTADVHLDVDLPAGLAVACQRDHLAHVLDNLATNAVKYGGGRLRARLGARGTATDSGAVVLRLSDDGGGVPCDLAPRLFERFSRGGSDPGAGSPGRRSTGLGLFIARQLALANGGDLALAAPTDRRPDEAGAVFLLTLPSPAPAAPGTAPAVPRSTADPQETTR